MKKTLLSLFALAVIVSACVKTPDAVRFSVLGDSFSAFEGFVQPDTNEVYHYNNIDVMGAEQMWWQQVADSMDWVMERNNSFSGALMCDFDDFHHGDHYGLVSFIRRMDDLGHPDVIFIFGGTNDIYVHAPLGDYVYEGWTEEQLHSFRPAIAYLLDNLKRQYPQVELYLMVDMELCIDDLTIDDEIRQAFVESMHHVANHYNVQCIDLYNIHKSSWHPDAEGQAGIARQVLEALEVEFNV